jgi:UDP-glucose 6-dehydrogenase
MLGNDLSVTPLAGAVSVVVVFLQPQTPKSNKKSGKMCFIKKAVKKLTKNYATRYNIIAICCTICRIFAP